MVGSDFEIKSKCLNHLLGPNTSYTVPFLKLPQPAVIMDVKYHGYIEEVHRIWWDFLID